MKLLLIIVLGALLSGCISSLSKLTHKDALAAQASAALHNDPSEKCWAKIVEITGYEETKIIGLLTAVQKARNLRKVTENEELRTACSPVALDILLTLRRLPFVP